MTSARSFCVPISEKTMEIVIVFIVTSVYILTPYLKIGHIQMVHIQNNKVAGSKFCIQSYPLLASSQQVGAHFCFFFVWTKFLGTVFWSVFCSFSYFCIGLFCMGLFCTDTLKMSSFDFLKYFTRLGKPFENKNQRTIRSQKLVFCLKQFLSYFALKS